MPDHTLPWLIVMLQSRIAQMGPRDRTVTLKFPKDGAKKLLADLERCRQQIERQKNHKD